MKSFLDKLRSRKTVLLRTKSRANLPKLVFYLDWLAGTGQRRVLDDNGDEHLIADNIFQSHYKLVSGGKAKGLIEKHWSHAKAEPQPQAVAPADS